MHLHLEGSLAPSTLRELDPTVGDDEIAARYCYRNFGDFIDAYKWTVGFLRGPADYALAARRLFAALDADNVTYAEVTLSAGVVLWKQLDFEAVFSAIEAETARAPITVYWVFDAIRHFGPDHARDVARLAAARAHRGVRAFGLGGDESRGPVAWFPEALTVIRDAGLKFVPHAGECTDAAAVRAALDAGADRIGHGIRAVHDPALMETLRGRNIPLEVCITSNVATGAVAAWEDHPVRRLYEAGVPIVLNTDDPGMFRTTLSEEYQLAQDRFGFTQAELASLARAAFTYSLGASR